VTFIEEALESEAKRLCVLRRVHRPVISSAQTVQGLCLCYRPALFLLYHKFAIQHLLQFSSFIVVCVYGHKKIRMDVSCQKQRLFVCTVLKC